MDSAQSICDRRKWFIHDDDEAIIIEEKKKKKSFENESTPRFQKGARIPEIFTPLVNSRKIEK